MRWLDVRQLKNLRRFPVPPEILAAGRVRLIAVIEASPMAVRPSVWFMSAAWRPVMAAMIVIVVVSGSGTVVAAHDALPRERLYVVKMAAEGVSERTTLSPERRFVVQAAHASRRLEETERLLEIQGIDGDDRAARVRSAMDRYEDHVFLMNEIVLKLEADPEKPKKGKKALRATEGLLDRHAHLIESATGAEPAVASAMIDRVEATFDLEADVFSTIPADDGGDGNRERQRRSREERVSESLKRMRAGLEERRVRERQDEDARSSDDRRDEDDASRDREGSKEESEDDTDAKTWIETGSSFDLRLEKPLEIRFGM